MIALPVVGCEGSAVECDWESTEGRSCEEEDGLVHEAQRATNQRPVTRLLSCCECGGPPVHTRGHTDHRLVGAPAASGWPRLSGPLDQCQGGGLF